MLGLDMFNERRRNLSNLCFDTSSSERIRGNGIQEAVKLFGFGHLIFGMDIPYATMNVQISKIDTSRTYSSSIIVYAQNQIHHMQKKQNCRPKDLTDLITAYLDS